MMKRLSESFEDYLEQIYVFNIVNPGPTPVTKLAQKMNVSKAAITKAMNKLADDGYVVKESYGLITLTDKGRELAKYVFDMHVEIRTFLLNIGVSFENARVDCCRLEHYVCEETIEKMRLFNQKMEQNK